MIRRLRDVVNDPLVARTLFWGVAAAVAIWSSTRFHVAFDYQHVYMLFTPKVPFLGLIIAAGTFQYRTWRELVDRDVKRITDPQWLAFERRVKTLQAQVEAAVTVAPLPLPDVMQLPEWERAIKAWKASNAEVTHVMLTGILPHSVALLGNFLFIGVCLLLSSTADAVLFLAGRDVQWLREVSSALFVVILLPFLESAVRYFLSLYAESHQDRKWFQEQHSTAIKESR